MKKLFTILLLVALSSCTESSIQGAFPADEEGYEFLGDESVTEDTEEEQQEDEGVAEEENSSEFGEEPVPAENTEDEISDVNEDETEEADEINEDTEDDYAEEESGCAPNTSWCSDNVLHTCNGDGQEYAPQDCGTDTCTTDGCRLEKALEFDGTGWVDLSDSALIRPLSEATVEFWFYWTGCETWGAVKLYGEGDDSMLNLNLICAKRALLFAEYYNNEWGSITTQDNSVEMGVWTHVAVVKHAGIMTVYLNGEHKVQGEMMTPRPGTIRTYIGMSPQNDGNRDFYTGIIDELRISDVARYSANFTPPARYEPDNDTIALWHMDEGVGRAITDEVSGMVGTMTGGVSWAAGR